MRKRKYYLTAAIALSLLALGSATTAPLRPELEQAVLSMHPTVQKRFRAFLRAVEKSGLRVKVWSAHRGWADSYRIWQTNPQVQACCQPGQDYHFFGLAIDIGIYNSAGQLLGNSSSRSAWEATGIREIARKYGLQWGIDFSGYFDPVHFAYPYKSMAGLVAKARELYGSLSNTPGNKMPFTGIAGRSWSLA